MDIGNALIQSEPRQPGLKVIFVVPSLRRGGAERQLVDLVKLLTGGRVEPQVFVFERELDLLDELRHTGIRVHHHPRRWRLDLSPARHLARVVDRESVDAVHCTMRFSLLMAWAARRFGRCRPPLVATLHSTSTDSLKRRLQQQFFYRHMLSSCARIVFVSERQRWHWQERLPWIDSRSMVIRNTVDSAQFDPSAWTGAGSRLRDDLGIPTEAPLVACVAGLRPEKGHLQLLEAAQGLPETVHLVIAGGGAERDRIEYEVRARGLGRRVHLMGWVKDVRPLLAAADVAVLPAIAGEALPLAVLEALAMATPVVATDVGGVSEAVVTGCSGRLVAPGDPEALRRALEQVLADRVALASMGAAGREMMIRRFPPHTMAEGYATMLAEVATDRKGNPTMIAGRICQ